MQEINVYVKGVVYQNKGKGYALSAWAVKGEPVHYIEHDVESAYGAEKIALYDALKHLHSDDVILHVYSNQKALIDGCNKLQYMVSQGQSLGSQSISPFGGTLDCDYIWCPLKESPDDLLRLREMAMQEVEKRGKARFV